MTVKRKDRTGHFVRKPQNMTDFEHSLKKHVISDTVQTGLGFVGGAIGGAVAGKLIGEGAAVAVTSGGKLGEKAASAVAANTAARTGASGAEAGFAGELGEKSVEEGVEHGFTETSKWGGNTINPNSKKNRERRERKLELNEAD